MSANAKPGQPDEEGRLPSRAGALVVCGLALLVSLGYGYARVIFNREFAGARWDDLVAFKAALPFGHRILVPLLARPFVTAGVPVDEVFVGFETLFTAALMAAVVALLRVWLDLRAAVLSAFGFVFCLAFPYLLPHRWPIFYPWDTPAMAFIAWGLAACIRRKFALAVLITAVAAANRETAIAIPLCSALLALEDVVVRRRALAWAGLMIAAYAAVRASIVVAVPGLPEETVRLFVDGRLRLLNNFDWLASWPGALQWMVGFAFTPLGWLAFWRWIPSDLRRLHLVVLGLFLGLMWAANVYEPRAFGAVYVLSWPPIFVGMARWLTLPASNSATPKSSSDYWVDRLDRWGAALLVSGFAASVVLAI